MEEITLTYGTIMHTDDFISRVISKDNLREIKKVAEETIDYLTNETIIFLQKIDGKWYIN